MVRNVISVFLASPSDVSEERDVVQHVVNLLNSIYREQPNVVIDLLKWEDSLSGYGRPQEQINKGVDICDVFLGILWKRWGQSTGKFTSGFEEEYNKVLERLGKTEEPKIWLFFKKVETQSVNDAGPELLKVLNFKKEQEEKKELLFKEFNNLQELQDLLHKHLSAFVLNKFYPKDFVPVPQQRTPHDLQNIEKRIIDETISVPSKTVTLQITELITKLFEGVKKDDLSTLNLLERLRLLLLSNTWFSEVYSNELFGVHETNIIYNNRNEIILSEEEKYYLFRTLISDTYNVIPCWYWFKEFSDKLMISAIINLLKTDTNISVRKGALLIFKELKLKIGKEFLKKVLIDENEEIILQAITIIQQIGENEYISLLDSLLANENSTIRESALQAKIEILLMNDPNKAFTLLIDLKSEVSYGIYEKLNDMELKLDNSLLIKALNEDEAMIRRFAAQQLRINKQLTKDICYLLLKDSSLLVRKEAILGLIEIGEDIQISSVDKHLNNPYSIYYKDEIIRAMFKHKDPEILLSLIKMFYSIEGSEAYWMLANNHFDIIKERIREDLENEFENLKIEGDKLIFGPFEEFKKNVLKDIQQEDTIYYVQSKYIAAALEGLAKNGEAQDIKYARKFLGKTKFNLADPAAIELIGKYGNNSDSKILIGISGRLEKDTKELAIKSAIKLSPGLNGAIKDIILSTDSEIVSIGLNMLSNIKQKEILELLKPLLLSELSEIRIKSLSLIVPILEISELENLLNEYINKQSYYYDVAVWLDRLIYAPGSIGNAFRKKLLSTLGIQ